MTRILLPTDFSENALTAIRYALTLYKDHKCTIFSIEQLHAAGISYRIFNGESGANWSWRYCATELTG